MYPAAGSNAKNLTRPATSSGEPYRLSGTADRILASISGPNSAVMSLLMKPGATALTQMLRDEYSRATLLVRPMTPA